MTLKLHIESIALEGVNISRRQRRQLHAALEAELTRLLTASGGARSLQHGGQIAKLPVSLTMSEHANPTQLGQAIAHSIHTDLTAWETSSQPSSTPENLPHR
jgi:hypothetical protein